MLNDLRKILEKDINLYHEHLKWLEGHLAKLKKLPPELAKKDIEETEFLITNTKGGIVALNMVMLTYNEAQADPKFIENHLAII